MELLTYGLGEEHIRNKCGPEWQELVDWEEDTSFGNLIALCGTPGEEGGGRF